MERVRGGWLVDSKNYCKQRAKVVDQTFPKERNIQRHLGKFMVGVSSLTV
jgi:hypothetical protein